MLALTVSMLSLALVLSVIVLVGILSRLDRPQGGASVSPQGPDFRGRAERLREVFEIRSAGNAERAEGNAQKSAENVPSSCAEVPSSC